MFVKETKREVIQPCREMSSKVELPTRSLKWYGQNQKACNKNVIYLRQNVHLTLYLRKLKLSNNMRHSRSYKLTVTRLVKKFLACYGTRRFITVFTRTRHWSLSWVTWIQSELSHPVSLKYILILSSHVRVGLPSGKESIQEWGPVLYFITCWFLWWGFLSTPPNFQARCPHLVGCNLLVTR
jgi:hypothetical protein